MYANPHNDLLTGMKKTHNLSAMTNTAPGWYPDPNAPERQRYYDGSAWTDQVAYALAPQKPDSVRQAVVIAVGILVAAAVVWFVYGLMTANDDLECATENAERVQSGLPTEDC